MEYIKREMTSTQPMSTKTDYSLIDREIGVRLKNRRLTLGISQMELADVLGITFQQVQKYEKGKNRINSSRLFHISDVLDIPISYFFQDIEHITNNTRFITTPAAKITNTNNKEVVELVQHFNGIDNHEIKQGLIKLARSMAEEYGKNHNSSNVSNDNS